MKKVEFPITVVDHLINSEEEFWSLLNYYNKQDQSDWDTQDIYIYQDLLAISSLLDEPIYINYSGGAYGADTDWDLIGREYGFDKHYHFRSEENKKLSKKLRDKGIEATIWGEEDKKEAYFYYKLLGGGDGHSLTDDLKARNYLQVKYADQIYAIATLSRDQKSVFGGTNWAIKYAKYFKKPIFVFDINSLQWWNYSYYFDKFITFEGIPELSHHYAGIGSRDIEPYSVLKDGVWGTHERYIGITKRNACLEAIENVYKKAKNII